VGLWCAYLRDVARTGILLSYFYFSPLCNFCCCQSPFKGDEEEEIFDAILTADVIYPSKLAPASVSILQALLQRDPAKRLGASESDAADVKAHPFFADMKWEAILKKQVPVTFKPTVVRLPFFFFFFSFCSNISNFVA